MKEKDIDTTPRPQTGRDDESMQSSSCCSGSKATYTDDHQEDYMTSTEPPCSSIWVVCPDGCECKNCEMQSELKLLRENVDNVLNNVYNEINSSEAELARYLDEIRDLEDELEVCLEQEKALLKEIGTATQCLDGKEDQLLDNPEAAIDEDVKVFQESEREFAIELKLRDEQIAELEKELQDNTNLIKYLSLSLNAGEQAHKYLS